MKLPQDRILHINTEFKDGKVNIVAEWQGELVRCKDCKHRYGDECPMRYVEWVTYDDDGYIEWDDIVHDNTMDEGYCSFGEREDDEA